MSLRARKKRLSMRVVQAAAMDLFDQHGFESVSVENVAEASGASPSTIYRHFKTKEGIALWDEQDSAIEAALAKHLGSVPPLTALRLAFTQAYEGLEPGALLMHRRRAALIDKTPTLQIGMAGSLVQARVDLVSTIGRVYGRSGGHLRIEMTVRIALECLVAGFEDWQGRGPRASLPGAIERAFTAADEIFHR